MNFSSYSLPSFFYMFRFDECNESQECLASIDSENIDITFDPTGLVVEGDVNDHTRLQENWHRFEQSQIEIDEPIKIINLGTEENPRNLKIGGNLTEESQEQMITLLSE